MQKGKEQTFVNLCRMRDMKQYHTIDHKVKGEPQGVHSGVGGLKIAQLALFNNKLIASVSLLIASPERTEKDHACRDQGGHYY
jgi:hypothetical protein